MRYFIFFFPYHIFGISYAFYTNSSSQLGLATFYILNSHAWQVAPMLDSSGLT